MSEKNSGYWADQMAAEGFRKIADLEYGQHAQLWWHPAHRIEVVLYLCGTVLLKGVKTYYMKAIGREGEMYARDLNALQEYLESHFPEVHIAFSHFRDITAALAFRRMREKGVNVDDITSEDELSEAEDKVGSLRRGFAAKRSSLANLDDLKKLNRGQSSSLVSSYLSQRAAEARQELRDLRQRGRQLGDSAARTRQLLREYQSKGAAACFVFSFASNLQAAQGSGEFRDALETVVKELMDAHRYQVMQKLNGGKLQIFVEEAGEPAVSWLTEWAGGVPNPRQLARLGSAFEELQEGMGELLMVTPSRDVTAGGAVRDEKKLLGAWVVRNFLKRLDSLPKPETRRAEIPEGNMPIWLGSLMDGTMPTEKPAVFPLEKLESVYISGATGSGKSFCARVLVEGAAAYGDIGVVILDPRNQSVGLLLPEDREEILALYEPFGMDRQRARGFEFRYYGPEIGAGEDLPADFDVLAKGRAIVSFKGMDDRQRCQAFACILEGLFAVHARAESETVRTVVVVEEAQLFTKKRVSDDARDAAERAERALETVLREGRKYGLRVFLVSQTIRDFAYGSASIRQNTNTKIFMRNSDREVDYASDFIENGREIIGLRTGTAICFNAQWGAVKFQVRPPLSKVWELSARDTRQLVNGSTPVSAEPLSRDATRLLEEATRYATEMGRAINLSEAGDRLAITSKRRMQEVVDELERKGLVRTKKLNERGRPRVIIPTSDAGAGGSHSGSCGRSEQDTEAL